MESTKLSIVIPAYNESGCIEQTVTELHQALHAKQIEHEIIVVDDNSSDDTQKILQSIQHSIRPLVIIHNPGPNGFGLAVRLGIQLSEGEYVAVYMADASDSPEDVIRFYETAVSTGVDCVFGTRFAKESKIIDYPIIKLFLNRIANLFIGTLFGLKYYDVTNAFKLYNRSTINGILPLISKHYNLTVELPLKAIIRGYSYQILPNSWTNRKTGMSKLRIREMGSRYLFIVLYCLVEKWLSRGDYHAHPDNKKNPRSKQEAA